MDSGLKIAKVAKKQRQQRVQELVSLMGLDGLEDRKPDQLCGGQQQRVALSRALARMPRLLLLDEPFGAVDAKVRQKLRADTKKWQRELKIPTILVTHDQREALELGDRVAVMSSGRIVQIDTPQNVYDNPSTKFVARFIGRVDVFPTELGQGRRRLINGTQAEIMVRPEDIAIHPRNGVRPLENGHILGTVASYAFLGRTVRLEVRLGNGRLVTVAVPKHQAMQHSLGPGIPVSLVMDSRKVFALDGAGLTLEEEE